VYADIESANQRERDEADWDERTDGLLHEHQQVFPERGGPRASPGSEDGHVPLDIDNIVGRPKVPSGRRILIRRGHDSNPTKQAYRQ
jgi:hypothetical protein